MKGQYSILMIFCAITGSLAKPPPTFLEYKDSYGQYSFGYSAPGSARSEVRSIDGSTRGSYTFIDASGIIQSAHYTADGKNGFQIIATNLPQAPKPVEDTPEVAAAKIDHLKAVEAASKLAEEVSQDDEQMLQSAVVDDEKSMESIVMENNAEVDDKVGISIEANGSQSSTESENTNINKVLDEVSMKDSAGGNLSETLTIPEKSNQDSSESIEPEVKLAESNQSDGPVMTTSYVKLGIINPQSRIELDRTGDASFQDETSDPSLMTPAETTLMMMTDSQKAELIDRMAPLPVAPMESLKSIEKPQEYSTAFVPGVITHPNPFALAYTVNVDQIYRHYSPYHYIHYSVL